MAEAKTNRGEANSDRAATISKLRRLITPPFSSRELALEEAEREYLQMSPAERARQQADEKAEWDRYNDASEYDLPVGGDYPNT